MLHCHRSLRALAEASAALGLPSLRLDYSACGNSADALQATTQHGHHALWLASIEAGIDHLRARCGVAQVALLAVRSGVLLAATVAARHPNVVALAALAPVTSGRRLLREWRALHSTAAHPSQRQDGALEVAGFSFNARTCQELGAVELASLQLPPRLAVQVIDRDDLPPSEGWASALRSAGLRVETLRLPGLAAMLDEPQRHVVPQQVVQASTQWLAALARLQPQQTFPQPQPQAQPQPQPAPRLAPAIGEAHTPAAVTDGVCESVWLLRGVDGQANPAPIELFGIVAEPAVSSGKTLLLVNTGPVHHVGGHRLYVELARQLAGRGHRVLRFDLSGIGDSPARPGEAVGTVYGPRAVDDIKLALQAVQQRWPGTQPQLLGLCSGAYHALKFAVAHSGAAQAFIVNPLVFHWRAGMSLKANEVKLQAAYYRSKWRRLESWKRLASGQSDLRLLLRVAAGQAVQALRGLAAARSGLPAAGADNLALELQTATAHGTRLKFIFAEGEPGWPMLQAQAGASLGHLQAQGLLTVQHLAQADHTFTIEAARQRLMDCVATAL